MKKFTLLLLVAIISTASFSQKKEKIKGDKDVTTVTNGFEKGFTAIEISDNLKVTLTSSLQNSYTLTTDKNLQDVIQFTVNEGLLKIYTTSNIVKSKKLDITLGLNNLEYIYLKDDAELKSNKTFESNAINIDAQNASKFDLDLKSKQVTIKMNSGAQGKLKLRADDLVLALGDKADLHADINMNITSASLTNNAKLRLDGSSDRVSFNTIDSSELDARRLKGSTADVTTTKGSEVHIDARKNLSIDARDKSKVFVYSEPRIDIKKFADRAEIIKR